MWPRRQVLTEAQALLEKHKEAAGGAADTRRLQRLQADIYQHLAVTYLIHTPDRSQDAYVEKALRDCLLLREEMQAPPRPAPSAPAPCV